MRSLAGAKALITGGAGLVGSTIADHLLAEGLAEIVLLDDFTRGRPENVAAAEASGRVRTVLGDIRDRELVAELMSETDLVFHQAALRITRCAEDPGEAMGVMVDGTHNVIEAALAARVDKVIAASSASVYGMATTFPTPEDHHGYGNRTLYGAAKAFGEGLLRSYASTHGLSYVALRYFNVYGPRMDIHGAHTEVLPRWMDAIDGGRRPRVDGDGTDSLDVVFVEDVARANVLAARAEVTDRVYNVASGTETSLVDLAHRLLGAMGSDLEPEFGPARRVNPVPRRLGDTRRAREELGFSAEVGLEEGLRRLVAWRKGESAGVP